MKIVTGLNCIRCRGMAYTEEGLVSCVNCGRTLAIVERLPTPDPRGYEPEPKPKGGPDEVKSWSELGARTRYTEEFRAIVTGWLLEGEKTIDVRYASGVGVATLKRWRREGKARQGLPGQRTTTTRGDNEPSH